MGICMEKFMKEIKYPVDKAKGVRTKSNKL